MFDAPNDENRRSYFATIEVELEDATEEEAFAFFSVLDGGIIHQRIQDLLFEASVTKVNRHD